MSFTLTKRQREALLAIHTLTIENGVAPTIREMRHSMDVASDQTIIEMLARLEKGGLITRDKKQARATSLTDKARLALGIVSMNGSISSEGPMELDDQEQKVYARLVEIDPRLGRIYKGALSTFRSPTNEDRIAQSAHSMREIIDHLSHKGSAGLPSEIREQISKDRGTRRTVHGLHFFFDPQASVAIEQNPYKHLYDEYQVRLQGIAHHQEWPDEENFRQVVRSLEYFLLRYVFPSQVEVYKILEDTLKKGPDGIDADDLKLLVKKNVESYRFFFKHADARWISYLRDHGFLAATWEVGDYLARIASERPDVVLEILLTTEMPKDALGAKANFSLAASKLPASQAGQTVTRILEEDWVNDNRATLLHYKLHELLKTLVDGKEYGPALALANALLDVFPEEYGSHGSRQTRGHVSEYEYEQLLKVLDELPAEEVFPFAEMMGKKLKKTLETVHARGEEGDEDYSYIWRPAIEGHGHDHSYERMDDNVISGVRDLLEKRITHLTEGGKTSDAKQELEAILGNTPNYPILTRLRLHIYRMFPEAFSDEIDLEIANPRMSGKTWHEYSLLVNAHFHRASPNSKMEYFKVVDNQDKSEDKYIDSWRVRLTGLISEELTPEQKEKYAALLKQAAQLEEPYFTSYSSGVSWVGPDSPKTEADLENKPIDFVLEIVRSWEPSGDQFFGPSHSGFGMVLRSVVTKEGEKYSAAAPEFLKKDTRPVYIYNLFSGLIESLKTETKLDWKGILDLATTIISRAKDNTLPKFENENKDRLETDWDGVMQELARLIVRGLDSNGIPLSERERVWSIIEHVAENPDPTPEHEEKYGANNSDPYTMSINTVRGGALHAVFAYIFWFNREEKNIQESWKANIPDEAKGLLELHLDPAYDPSLAVRSVYGRFFPWMLSYGDEWAKELIPIVFPTDNTDMRYAAWETYLSNMVFEDAYKLMRPLYELAVEDIRKGRVPKRRYWIEATQRLAEHAMIGYAFEVDPGENSFPEYFFAHSSGKTRGMAVSLGGRAYISRDGVPAGEKTPRIETLQRFWDWRLEKSDAPSELREFGWWTKLGKFDNKWMLERLLKTVEKTKGDIDGEFIVMNSLQELAGEHPLLCAKITKYIFASSNRRDRYTFLHMSELHNTLVKILQSKNEEAIKISRETIDYLLKLGFEDFRNIADLPDTPLL